MTGAERLECQRTHSLHLFFRDYRASHEWKEEEKGIEECVMSVVNPGIPPTQGDRPDRSFN